MNKYAQCMRIALEFCCFFVMTMETVSNLGFYGGIATRTCDCAGAYFFCGHGGNLKNTWCIGSVS
jgi:hypothetical protein